MSALYKIYGTDGVLKFTLSPGKRDIESHNDLRFSGSGNIQWGEDVNQNLFNLLENFACPELPSGLPETSTTLGPSNGINKPVIGQLWFNTTKNSVFAYTGSVWMPLGGVSVSGIAPIGPILGSLWYDTTIPQLKIWDGAIWISVADRYVSKTGDTMTGDLVINRGASLTGAGLQILAKTSILKLENSWTSGQVNGIYSAPGLEIYNPDNDPSHGSSSTYPWTHLKSRDGYLFTIEGATIPDAGVSTTEIFRVHQNGIISAPQSSILKITSGLGTTLVTKDYLASEISGSLGVLGNYVPKVGNTTITGNIAINGTTTFTGNSTVNGLTVFNGNTTGSGSLTKTGDITSSGTVTGTLNVKVGANNVWHAGNFDPNTKQNVLGYTPVNKAGDIIPSSSVTQYVSPASGMGTATAIRSLEIVGSGGGAAYMSFHRPGAYASYFGLDMDNNWRVGGWSAGAIAHKLWHSGNDGSGSGLNADLLDGVSSESFVQTTGAQSITGIKSFNTSPSAPFTTNSATKVTNLNADLLDGYTAADFLRGIYQSGYSSVGIPGNNTWYQSNILGFVTGATGAVWIVSPSLVENSAGYPSDDVQVRMRLSNGTIVDSLRVKSASNPSTGQGNGLCVTLSWIGALIPNTYYTVSIEGLSETGNSGWWAVCTSRSSVLV